MGSGPRRPWRWPSRGPATTTQLFFWPFDEKVRIATIREMLELARDKVTATSSLSTLAHHPFAANHMALEKDHGCRCGWRPSIKSFQYDLMAHRLSQPRSCRSRKRRRSWRQSVSQEGTVQDLDRRSGRKYLGMRPGQVLRLAALWRATSTGASAPGTKKVGQQRARIFLLQRFQSSAH